MAYPKLKKKYITAQSQKEATAVALAVAGMATTATSYVSAIMAEHDLPCSMAQRAKKTAIARFRATAEGAKQLAAAKRTTDASRLARRLVKLVNSTRVGPTAVYLLAKDTPPTSDVGRAFGISRQYAHTIRKMAHRFRAACGIKELGCQEFLEKVQELSRVRL